MEDIGLMTALKAKMSWLSHRQKVVAENVANSSTPGYVAHDLKPLDFKAAMAAQKGENGEQLAMTQAGHMPQPNTKGSGAKSQTSPDSETTLNRNSVTLEDEMIKMAETRMEYEAALGFYQKSLDMVRMAARAPGR